MSDVERIAGDRLRSFVERIERLEAERAELGADVREVYAEAKFVGLDVKVLRLVVAARRKDPADRNEEEEFFALYCSALGMAS